MCALFFSHGFVFLLYYGCLLFSFLYYCYFLLVLGCFEDRVTWLDHYLSEGYCWTWTPVDRSAGSTAICSRSTVPFFWFILSFFKECQVLRFKQIKIKIVFSYEMFIISGSLSSSTTQEDRFHGQRERGEKSVTAKLEITRGIWLPCSFTSQPPAPERLHTNTTTPPVAPSPPQARNKQLLAPKHRRVTSHLLLGSKLAYSQSYPPVKGENSWAN